jgi:putative intracellular protease/amidase
VAGDAGYEVEFVSPKGGYTPIEPHSLAMADRTDWELVSEERIQKPSWDYAKPSEGKPNDYVAIYYTGGHGVIWDFPEDEALQSISRKIYENGGFVSSVCHGAVGLLNIKLSDGSLLIKGKSVTGFSNEEEKLAELDKFVPFLTETELMSRGATYKKADRPWAPFAIEDKRLITGQNPASGGTVADLLIGALQK